MTLLALNLGHFKAAPANYRPPVLEPLFRAVETGADLGPILQASTEAFGFSTFMWGISAAARPMQESRQWVFTTLPHEWVREYDQNAYIEVDPRLEHFEHSSLPFVWDQPTMRGKSTKLDAYLEASGRYGSRSGVAFSWRPTERFRLAILCFNSPDPIITPERMRQIEAQMGDMLLWATFFQDFYLTYLQNHEAPEVVPVTQGAKLSAREVEVLSHIARGGRTKQVASLLGVSPGTIQLHMDSIRSKLGATSRAAAIATALSNRIITI